MNILFLNSARYWGGNELWTATAANELSRRGHSVAIAARSDIFYGKVGEKIDILRFPFLNELDFHTANLLKLNIKKRGVELLLPTKRKEYFIAGRIGRRMNLPVVFRLGITRNISKLDIAQRYVYSKLPTAVIVNCKAIRDELAANGVVAPDKIKVVYNGYDFPENPGEPDAKIKTDKFVFAAAGRLTAQKGFDILLEAAKILKSQKMKFYVYIAGDGAERDVYTKYIRENKLENRVFLLGGIENVRAFFEKAGCVVIPSRSEGIPNALFEAWSVKKPVVASDVSGLPEIVETYFNGVSVPPVAEEIAQSMAFIMENPENAALFGERGYELLNSKFRRKDSFDKFESILHDVLHESK